MKERGGISGGFVPLSDVGCRSLPGGIWREKSGTRGSGRGRGKGIEGVVSWRNSFHCNVFKKIPIKTVFIHFSGPLGARTALGSIIGSGAMSPYPFHSMLVCLDSSQLVFLIKKKKNATYSEFRSPFVLQTQQHT